MKCIKLILTRLAIVASSSLTVSPLYAERAYFNDKKVPTSIEDILSIEEALKNNLEASRNATVSITDGMGFGSGVIVSEDGLVMTAAHVTAGVNKKLEVILEDGKKLQARSLGLDSDSDAALLQIIDEDVYPFVDIDKNPKETMSTKLGDWVYSIGHSGGFDEDRGSVVRLGRIVRLNDFPATFQSDCKLIGGDSGGPLFNMQGELIGIHSRVGKVVDQNMHVTSYDFFAEDPEKGLKWDRMLKSEFIGEGPFAQRPVPGQGFMGFALEESDKGLKVIDVDEEAAAGAAGIKVGDVLLSLNGEEMKTKAEVKDHMDTKAEGDGMELVVNRDGEEVKLELFLDKR